MNKKISINFLHPQIYKINDIDEKLKLALKMLSISNLRYDFVWGENECDYLFISESIYYGEYCKQTRKKYNKILKQCSPILIFHAGECIEPDFNIFDYAVVFDRKLKYEDRCCRMPFSLRFYEAIVKETNYIDTEEKAQEELKKKKYFCNFIYSNGSAHENRDKLFYDISKYKKVYSLGKHLKNFEIPKNEIKVFNNWILESIEIKNKFKFSIASENASYNGYTSEKIYTSFQAHTIPIYWGDPLVKEEFNEEAFVNVNNFKSEKELIQYIKEIDENDELWCKIISKPWRNDKQIEEEKIQIDNYYNFMSNIFKQNLENAKRAAEGCHPDRYRKSFYKWKGWKSTARLIIGKVKYRLKEIIKK